MELYIDENEQKAQGMSQETDSQIQKLLHKSMRPIDFVKNPPIGERFVSVSKLTDYLACCMLLTDKKMKNGECSALTAEVVNDYVNMTKEMLDQLPGIVYDDTAYVKQIYAYITLAIKNRKQAEDGLNLYLPNGYKLLICFKQPDKPTESDTTWHIFRPENDGKTPLGVCSQSTKKLTNKTIITLIRWAYETARKDAVHMT